MSSLDTSPVAFIQRLQVALQQPLPGVAAQERMAGRVVPPPEAIPPDARPSAVLGLLFPHEDALNLLFIRRTDDGRAHGGQISFPGGRQDPSDADLRATALREAQEEVGIRSSEVRILGGLTPLYIPVSNFQVYPYIGFAEQKPVYNISTGEVAYVLEAPLGQLFAPERKIITEVRPSSRPGLVMRVPAYALNDQHFIWGATAMILSEFEAIFREIAGVR
jgi:8-oxo-dGTP pyrophosphatase MutT (NUDIX family)